MTIIKSSSHKSDKAILEKKLLQETLEEGGEAPPPEVHVTHDISSYQRRKCLFNLFLILLALSVLAAGIVCGIYLYKHLSRKLEKGHINFEVQTDTTPYKYADKPYYLPREDIHKEKDMMEPFDKDLQSFGRRKHKNRHPSYNKFNRMHSNPFKVEQDVEVEDNKYERIHMPKFGIFRETLVLHDFTRNYSGIVDFEDKRCYVMRLNREKITPPRDWFDLIRKFATGYYMPKASVLKRKYRVAEGPLSNIHRFGFYIQNECKDFATYWLEKKVGDGLIEKRSAKTQLSYGFFNGIDSLIEYDITNE